MYLIIKFWEFGSIPTGDGSLRFFSMRKIETPVYLPIRSSSRTTISSFLTTVRIPSSTTVPTSSDSFLGLRTIPDTVPARLLLSIPL